MVTIPALNAAGQASQVKFTVAPLQADGVTPGFAVLSALTFTSSDPTIATVAADPANHNGGIVTVVNTTSTAPLSDTITANATGTEPGGFVEQLTGSDVVTVTPSSGGTTPPANQSTSLGFTWGTPS